MSALSVERKICQAARAVTGRPKLRLKDILAWSTDEAHAGADMDEESEVVVFLPDLGVWVLIPREDK